ncbi:MAG: hypothetical protein HQ594_02375 [Candidatus Omnitrophica bacterium]|nr:hypothetical protein [Candidatus Omnitrophota bacterium]
MTTRSKGVTILSVLIIIGSVLGLGGLASPDQLNPPISLLLYFIVLPLSIVVAVFLLKLKPWARQAIVIISIIVAIESFATLPYVLKRSEELYSESIKENLTVSLEEVREKRTALPGGVREARPTDLTGGIQEVQNLQLPEEEVEKLAVNMFKGILTFLILLSVGFNAAVIYFFTRPEVIGQFSA